MQPTNPICEVRKLSESLLIAIWPRQFEKCFFLKQCKYRVARSSNNFIVVSSVDGELNKHAISSYANVRFASSNSCVASGLTFGLNHFNSITWAVLLVLLYCFWGSRTTCDYIWVSCITLAFGIEATRYDHRYKSDLELFFPINKMARSQST